MDSSSRQQKDPPSWRVLLLGQSPCPESLVELSHGDVRFGVNSTGFRSAEKLCWFWSVPDVYGQKQPGGRKGAAVSEFECAIPSPV